VLVAVVVVLLMTPTASAASRPREVTIIRDEFGVPHLFADGLESLFHGMGYVAADDRLWQAEILRRSATGTLAEIFGPSVLPGDIDARRMFGPAARRAEAFQQAPRELRLNLNAYAAGINRRVEEERVAGTLPAPFAVFGPPRPWTPDDSVAVFMLLGSQFGWFGSDELTNLATWQALQGRFGPDAATVFGDLFWLDDPDAPTTLPAEGAADAVAAPAGAAPNPPVHDQQTDVASAATAHRSHAELVDQARAMAGLPADARASNAIVIGPSLSASGNPLLLGGPQMGYSTPQINHEVGLHGGGFDVTGMTIAGFPLVPIGVGDGYAWTLTSGGSDNTDIYQEALNPADPTQYRFDGQWRSLDCRSEAFAVAGAAPQHETLCSSVHGPVIAAAGTTAFTLKNVTVGHELDSLQAWTQLGRANDIDDVAAALDDVAYNFNLLYADRDGNIAYWHIGHMPVRAEGFNPFLPLPGTGEAEWQGVRPFAENPQVRNPAQGWMASWNNKPAPGWANSSADFWLWGGAHRVNTLRRQLAALSPGSATIETLEAINRTGGWTTDTPTGTADAVFVTTYLEEMLAAVDPTADARLAALVGEMTAWDRLQVDADGDGFYDNPYGTIFNAWWAALASTVFDEVADLTNQFVLGNLVDRMLAGEQAGLPLQYDYLDGASVTDATTAALIQALDELTVQFGTSNITDWRQPVATIDWEPLPLTPGAGSTIWMNRGTYNQILELDGDTRAENVIAPGQSGEAASPHFADQLGLYATWTYKPMRLSRDDLRGHTESIVRLVIP
jgi:penicillin amidase